MIGPRPSGAERVARVLREEARELDEVTHARLERAVLRAAQEQKRGVSRTELRASVVRASVLAGLSGAVVAAALMWFATGSPTWSALAGSPGASSGVSRSEVAAAWTVQEKGRVRFARLRDDGALVTGASEVARLRVSESLFEVGPGARARVVRLDEDEVRFVLDRGRLSVAFHPKKGSGQSLRVETGIASVEVVGTVFDVEVEPRGATRVRVTEGVVRVIDRRVGEARLVLAGQEVRLGVEGERGDAGASESASQHADASESAEASEGAGEHVGAEAADVDVETRFARADRYLARGEYGRARRELYAVARGREARGPRAVAFQRVADSFEREGDYAAAADALRRAAKVGGRTAHGLNATFALGRLLERRLGNRGGAVAAYRAYLAAAPEGPHAGFARENLCRLGHCP